jgi:hypothetical protein
MSGNEWTVLQSVALASLLAWASGLRLYLVVFAVGLAGYYDYITLPAGLDVLKHPWVFGAAGVMVAMEFLADKVPYLDSIWDAVHTFIRIPAGALLAAGATGDTVNAITVAAGLLGGTITAGTHFAKAGGRAVINASPEPVSNWGASFSEDALVISGIWLAFAHPMVFLGLMVLFLLLLVWLIPKVWRGIRWMLQRLEPQPAG